MGKKKTDTELVAEGLRKLAFGDVNDAVRLAFCDEMPSAETLAGMNLFLVSEIKRDKGGGVEVRFFDRLKAIEKLYDYAHAGENGAAAASLLEALTGAQTHEL